jgi:regulatory protein
LRSSTPSLPWLRFPSLGYTVRAASLPIGERLWHKNGVDSRYKARQPVRPLNESSLQELALRYVGKYATTRAKLRAYLARKIRERGWDGPDPGVATLADRLAALGYVDDASYALGKSRALSARGYGKRRLQDQLRLAGVDETDGAEAHAHADRQAVDAAVRFASRRRIGAFAPAAADPRQRDKWITAMVRAGHGFGLARALASLTPGAEVDHDQLRESARINQV